jgi:serine/threonine-protein kinase
VGNLYYVIPYVAGESLRARLAREKQLPLDEALAIATGVASALEYAHQQGVVHRDIKPDNVLMSQGEPMVTDFGIALAVSVAGSGRLTDSGLSLGTPEYMSPEQALGDPDVDARSDVYSLGCTLYEMLAGSPPYTGATAQAIVSQVVTASVPSVRAIRQAVPEHVDHALHRALAKVRADRFGTVRSFSEALSAPGPPEDAGRRQIRIPRWALTAGLALLVGVAALVVWALRPSPVGYGGIGLNGRVSLLLSTDGLVEDPALSPDGKLIAYVMSEPGGHRDLYVRRVAGGQVIRLTNDDAAESTPRFSPDGESIVFARRSSDAAEPAIWIMPALGGAPALVIRDGQSPAWAPSGDRIALVRREAGRPDVMATVRSDGTEFHEIYRDAPPYLVLRALDWSPDGSEIALVRSLGGGAGEIWRVSLDGRSARHSRDAPDVQNGSPAYTPDGRGILHSSSRGGATNLWIAPAGDGEPIRLTAGSGPDEAPTVARDGTVAYLNSRWHQELYVYDLRQGIRRALWRHAASLWAPAFSPDGNALAVSGLEADGAWHIWTVSVEDGTPRQLTTGSPPQIYPRFTPDGQAVIYQSWTADSSRIWRVPIAGGPPVPLTAAEEDAAYGDISPDGTLMAYVRSEEVERIYVAPVHGGPPRRLTESPGSVPRWSPDGSRLAFSRSRDLVGGIFVINADGTGERRLTERGGWPVWWPDGTRIAYRTLAQDGGQQIHVVPLAGGPSQHLSQFVFSGRNSPFDVSPDGRFMGLTRGVHLADEIWVIHSAQ